MNCPQCGQPVQPGSAFCGNCGQALTATSTHTPVSTSQQTNQNSSTTIAQVYSNQPNVPTSAVNNFTQPMVANHNQASSYPAALATSARPGESMGIIGLIMGVIGVPASIVPVLGLFFGIAGLVLSTISRSKQKRALTIFGIIISSFAILISLAFWVYAITKDPALHKTAASSSSSSAAHSKTPLVTIATPCYSVKIDGGLNNYNPSGCSFNSANSSEEFTVQAQQNSSVNSSNLEQVGHSGLLAAAGGTDSTISNESTGMFAGSPAYIAKLKGGGSYANQNMIAAVVYHPTSSGYNVFMIVHDVANPQRATFGTLENNWSWK